MLTQTTILAIRVIICLAVRGDRKPVCHQVIAEQLGASESYLSKIITRLTKQGILITQRGPAGGTRLAREPEAITLLDVVHACEGTGVMAFYPGTIFDPETLCPLHRAMVELEATINETLAQWTFADMRAKTGALSVNCSSRTPCFMRQAAGPARPSAQHNSLS